MLSEETLIQRQKKSHDEGRKAFAAELLAHLDRTTSTTAAFHLVKNLCKIELGLDPDSLGLTIDDH